MIPRMSTAAGRPRAASRVPAAVSRRRARTARTEPSVPRTTSRTGSPLVRPPSRSPVPMATTSASGSRWRSVAALSDGPPGPTRRTCGYAMPDEIAMSGSRPRTPPCGRGRREHRGAEPFREAATDLDVRDGWDGAGTEPLEEASADQHLHRRREAPDDQPGREQRDADRERHAQAPPVDDAAADHDADQRTQH